MTESLAQTAPGAIAPGPILVVRQLGFAYPNSPPILQAVDFRIWPGERVGLIGPNGAGKTTLFLLLCGVLSPQAGKIILFGQSVAKMGIRSDVGLVFQNPEDQLFCLSVWEDVAFGPQNLGLAPGEVEQRVAAALALTGTQALASRPSHHLSGGEKRMVAIACVQAMQPQLVIYDEPSANLDTRSRRRLVHFLQTSPETQLIASHDLELILEVCDRVLLLDEGRLIASGPPAQLMGNGPLMEAHGLEIPHSLRHSH